MRETVLRRLLSRAQAVIADESGAATVLVAAVLGALAVLLCGFVAAGAATARTQQIDGAADAAALAAADALAGYSTQDPCAIAGTIASAAGASVTECTVSGMEVAVLLSADFAGYPFTARSRAGPDPGRL